MAILLVDKELSKQSHDSSIAQAAKAVTLTVIRELDSERIKQLIDFLRDAQLIQNKFNEEGKSTPELLKNSNLSKLNLANTNLSYVSLSNANLSGARLNLANLNDANLSGAELFGADLYGAELFGADLSDDADLSNADLSYAALNRANLSNANLSGAKLFGADLRDANLSDADLNDADLRGVSPLFVKRTNFKGTHFGNNKGISKEMKLDLEKRGAIFEDGLVRRSALNNVMAFLSTPFSRR